MWLYGNPGFVTTCCATSFHYAVSYGLGAFITCSTGEAKFEKEKYLLQGVKWNNYYISQRGKCHRLKTDVVISWNVHVTL